MSRFRERTPQELMSHYTPAYLSKGGEHIVYDIPETPRKGDTRQLSEKMPVTHPDYVVKRDVVFKAHAPIMKWVIDESIKEMHEPGEMTPFIKERLENVRRALDRKFADLRDFFGAEHVANQKSYTMKVPVTPDILSAMYKTGTHPDVESAWTRVTIQRKQKELMDGRAESLNAPYLEKRARFDGASYARLHEALLHGRDLEPSDWDALESLQFSSTAQDLLTRSRHDEGLAATMREFVSKAVQYSNQTTETLDLVGPNNVIFFRKENADGTLGDWTYKLVDAFHAGADKGGLEQAEEALTRVTQGGEPSVNELYDFMNTFNYVRTINMLADDLGLDERIVWDGPMSTGALGRVHDRLIEMLEDDDKKSTKLPRWDAEKTTARVRSPWDKPKRG